MRTRLLRGALLAATSLSSLSLSAQSPLTTLFAQNNGGAAGWTMYFDFTVNVPLTFVQFDVNTGSTVGTLGSLNVYWLSGTYVGNDTNAAAWTLGGSGPVTAAALNTPSSCTITPFTLAPGNYGIAIVHNGIAPSYTNGTGTSVPGSGSNQTYSTAELTLRAGASAGGGLGTAICCAPRVINCNIYYSAGGSGTVATRQTYGNGCYAASLPGDFGSFYENFATSAAFDLANSGMSMLNTGAGYVVLPAITAYVPPSGAAVPLTLTDDSETSVTLSSPFPYVGGATNALTVCSNGYVSVASGNGTGFTPVVATMLAAPQTGWWNWHDYNPAAGGQVKFEEVGTTSYITWDAVFDFGSSSPNTFQFQFERATGIVHLIWGSMSTAGNGRLVGYSPGGPSGDPGNRDISATLPGTFSVLAGDLAPLALAASARPLIGTGINLSTSNIPAGTGIGATLLGTAQHNPGISLAAIGMAGCSQYASADTSLVFIVGGATANVLLNIPNTTNLLALHVYCQSASFSSGFNPLGVLASNGLDLGLGNL